jgi:quercetin dioxygenase-like cupin family protein
LQPVRIPGSTGDVLSTVLRTVHLAGHDVTEVAADPPAKYVQRDHLGALHLVEGGEVRLEVVGAEPHLLGAGDVALLPAGRDHALLATQPGARWLTGTFVYDSAAVNRLLAELPAVIAFEHLRESGYEWFDVSFRLLAKERREPTPGALVMISRILDLIYIQLLRLWATSTENSPGWLRAGLDRDIGGLLDAIHANPARAWSNAEMAQYAFNRAFTRFHGRSPGQWRREHSAG